MIPGYYPYLYNNISPGGGFELEFEEDLFELFGTEDLTKKGLVGKWDSQLGDFKSARWNWGYTSLKGFTGMLFLLKCIRDNQKFSYPQFEKFYEEKIKHEDNITKHLNEKNLIELPLRMIYTMKYRDYYFPALLLRIERIEWNKKEHSKYPIYITFTPETYFVMDNKRWSKIDELCRDKNFWIKHLKRSYEIELTNDVEKILSSYTFTQNLYRLMPKSLLEPKFLPEPNKNNKQILYIKDVESHESELTFTDNQIFWGLFHHITNTKQQVYTPELKYNGERFQIRNIPINTLSDRTNVFKQEAGVANALCHVLLDIFEKKYLEVEFDGQKTVSTGETSVFKRAVKLGEVANNPKERFENTDFDYGIFLEKLGIENTFLFSLTTALWNKGRGKTYDDYIKQSREMLFRTPLDAKNLTTIWFIAVDDTESSWFEKQKAPETSLKEMIDRIVKDLPQISYEVLEEGTPSENTSVIIIPIFNKTPQSKNVSRELDGLLTTPKETRFYSIISSLIKNS